jgi:hypothetical protein
LDRLLQPPPQALSDRPPQSRRLRTTPHIRCSATDRCISRCPHPGGAPVLCRIHGIVDCHPCCP